MAGVLSSTASGAATGASVGGPWGAAIGGGIGLATSLFGQTKGAKANKEAEAALNKYADEQTAFYDTKINRDFMESNAAKGVVTQLKKQYQDRIKTIDSKGAATGATAEASIAAKTSANEQVNNAMNNISQQATAYQNRAEEGKMRMLSDLYSKRMQLNANKADNGAKLVQTGANLMGTAAQLGALGKSDSISPNSEN